MHPEIVPRRARAPARSAAWRSSRGRSRSTEAAEPRAARHDAPVLGRRSCSTVPRLRARDVRTWSRASRSSTRLAVRALDWVQLALATPVVLWGGWPFFARGWASIVNRSPNMFTLIALGIGRGVRLQRRRPRSPRASSRPSFRGHGGEVGALLRGGGGHHGAGAARAGAGAPRAEPHQRRDPGAARAGAEDGAASCATTGARRTSPLDRGRGRRPAARAAGREGPGRRRRRRGPERGRRVDGHRRADARSRRRRATGSSAARSTAPAAS